MKWGVSEIAPHLGVSSTCLTLRALRATSFSCSECVLYSFFSCQGRGAPAAGLTPWHFQLVSSFCSAVSGTDETPLGVHLMRDAMMVWWQEHFQDKFSLVLKHFYSGLKGKEVTNTRSPHVLSVTFDCSPLLCSHFFLFLWWRRIPVPYHSISDVFFAGSNFIANSHSDQLQKAIDFIDQMTELLQQKRITFITSRDSIFEPSHVLLDWRPLQQRKDKPETQYAIKGCITSLPLIILAKFLIAYLKCSPSSADFKFLRPDMNSLWSSKMHFAATRCICCRLKHIQLT